MYTLNKILPFPLENNDVSRSDIWSKETSLPHTERTLCIAPSGKGKTSLLHILYGLRNDYHGTAQVNGNDVRKLTPDQHADLRKQSVSIIFQDLRLFPQLTGIENIKIKNEISGYKSDAEIAEMIDRLGMTPFAGQVAQTLSYGQRQRIAIIRALCQPFKILLLDEPFSHLDQDNINLAINMITAEADKQQAGWIMVSLGEDYGMAHSKRVTL